MQQLNQYLRCLEENIMNEAILTTKNNVEVSTAKILTGLGKTWFLVAFIGQIIFALYISSFYGLSAIKGDFEIWNSVLPQGYIPGDTIGNIVVALHVLFAAVITLCGPLQLLPQIRKHTPKFHRVNGRIYALTALIMALGGLHMIITREAIGAPITHVSIAINALLIILFVVQTVRFAIAKKINIHNRWAIRLFLAVSGVWFYRVGLMLWMTIHGKPVGFDMATFSGPFLTFLSFSSYLLPLFVFELYQYVKARNNTIGNTIMSAGMILLTLGMAVGIFAATMGMWLPRIMSV